MFSRMFHDWLKEETAAEPGRRRREILENGLSRGSIAFLRDVWYPAVGHFTDLHPEWELRDLGGGYRYLDFAYTPGGARGAIEIQGFGPHARDLDATRFKDLCWRHSYLALEGWTLLPVAYLSVRDEPERCQQLILAFIGKFTSLDVDAALSWTEAELVRFARRRLMPITPGEAAVHLRVSEKHARRLCNRLAEKDIFRVANGQMRYRTYEMNLSSR
ncbi:MAG TPA: transcriptional regulator [Bacillales bacterium]|nr:transcriptional regulator [Bacillales bacterium]